jgi:hypothetical protein
MEALWKSSDTNANEKLRKPITILLIDSTYRIFYFVLQKGTRMRSVVPSDKVLELIRKVKVDLIIFEPQLGHF